MTITLIGNDKEMQFIIYISFLCFESHAEWNRNLETSHTVWMPTDPFPPIPSTDGMFNYD